MKKKPKLSILTKSSKDLDIEKNQVFNLLNLPTKAGFFPSVYLNLALKVSKELEILYFQFLPLIPLVFSIFFFLFHLLPFDTSQLFFSFHVTVAVKQYV